MNQLLGIVFFASLLVGCGGSSSGLDSTAPTQNTAPTILVNGSAQAAAFEVSLAEGTTAVATVTASDAESSASLSLSGVDADLFELSGDQLSFIAAPDFETPLSTGGNVYSVTAVASDGGANTNQHIEVTVTNVVELAGRVTDGPIAGASVFVDLNCNNAADAGEPTGTTDADGYFEINSGIVAQEGCDPKIIATGGTDTATGEDRAGVALVSDLPAGEANSNVSPLTTIIAAADTAEAKQAVLTALGFSEDTTVDDVLTIDSWAGAEADDAGSQAIQRVNAMLATIMSTAASVADDGDAATDTSIAVALAVANAVLSQVEAAAATDDTSVDLTASDIVASVLTDTVAEAAPDLVVTEAVINAVASVVATVNTVASDPTVNPTSAQAISVATVAQTSVQDSVADVVSGETTVEEFETATDTGTIFADVPTDPDAPDFDGDGLADSVDPDDDNDGVNDNQDVFPMDATETVDTDGDGTGDTADTDDDGDLVADVDDAFPLDSSESLDTDGDGTGNNADTDDDGDSVADGDDVFPLDSTETVDTDGDGIGNNADTDDDGDQVPDIADLDPLDPAVGGNGFKVEHVALHDFVDGAWQEDAGHVVYGLDPTVSGSTVTIAPQNSLDVTNLQALADSTSEIGASPQLSLLFSVIPSDGESGTMTVSATITDGSDATREAGERSITTSLSVEWSSTGDAITAAVPAQTTTLVYVDGSGVAVEKTYSNATLDDVVFGKVFDGVWSLDMKIANFLSEVGGDITFGDFLTEGTYFMDVQIDQPAPQLPNLYYGTDLVDSVQGSFTVADVSLEVTNGFSLGFVDIVTPNVATIGPPPATAMMLGETLQVLFTDSVDLASLIALSEGDLSVAESPQLTFQMLQVPDAGESGSFTIVIGVTDGNDSTRDTGERLVSGELTVEWSSDGSNAFVNIPAQNAPVSIIIRDGTAVEATFNNIDPDGVTVTSGENWGMPDELDRLNQLNIRLMSFFSANNGYDLTDAFVAGDYFVDVTITGLDNLHYDGLPIDSVQAVVPVE